MKLRFCIISILLVLGTVAFGQNKLDSDQKKAIKNLISLFRAHNKEEIAALVYYPLTREYPLKTVKNKDEFIQRFDEILDKDFVTSISKSSTQDWSEVGWRGITWNNGAIWIDNEARIVAINYQSENEKKLLANAIEADKRELPEYLQDFEKPVYLIATKKDRIRIDKKSEENFRYAAWKKDNNETKPGLVLENGTWAFDDNGGNHTITFIVGPQYILKVEVNITKSEDTADVKIKVIKGGKEVVNENGNFITN